MAGTKKPKRKYDPSKAVKTILNRREREYMQQPLYNDHMRDLGIAFHVAFDLMRSGRGDEETWSTLACVTDLALILAAKGLGEEHIEQLREALAGLRRTKERADATGRWAFDGDAMTAVALALEIHDAQLRAATVGEMREAMEDVQRQLGRKIGSTH